jgi:hypothetical protein
VKRLALLAATAGALAAPAATAMPPEAPLYIVVTQPTRTDLAGEVARAAGFRVVHRYRVLSGFAARLTPTQAGIVAANRYVVQLVDDGSRFVIRTHDDAQAHELATRIGFRIDFSFPAPFGERFVVARLTAAQIAALEGTGVRVSPDPTDWWGVYPLETSLRDIWLLTFGAEDRCGFGRRGVQITNGGFTALLTAEQAACVAALGAVAGYGPAH